MNPFLFNIPFDEQSMLEWSSLHQKDHFGIASQIFQKMTGTMVLLMPIDPVPLQLGQTQMLTWAMIHQFMHNEMDNAVGVMGFNLTAVNFFDRDELTNWMQLHAMEHFNVWQALSQMQPGQPTVTPSASAASFAQVP